MDRFPRSMRMVGLAPGFTREQWDIVMSIPRQPNVRSLAYEEWLAEQDERYESCNWRWHLSYLHGPGIIPLYRPKSPISSIEHSTRDIWRDDLVRPPLPPSNENIYPLGPSMDRV